MNQLTSLQLTNLLSKFGPLTRTFSISAKCRLKEIRITDKDEQTTVIEAVKVLSPRQDKVLQPPVTSNDKACPLCRLNLRRLSYTDVLILNQFVESNGQMMPQSVTGLCNRQHNKVRFLVRLAQRFQLMPRPTDYEVYGPWEDLNTYSEHPKRIRDKPLFSLKPEYWR